MKRALAAVVAVAAGTLCLVRWFRHDPERVETGLGWRCRRCGASAPTELELLEPVHEDGHVRPARSDQRARLHGGRAW